MGVDALRLLHRLSSDPNSADDALKLMHGLQVHQVELDLQNEEISTSETALVEELKRYKALYKHLSAVALPELLSRRGEERELRALGGWLLHRGGSLFAGDDLQRGGSPESTLCR